MHDGNRLTGICWTASRLHGTTPASEEVPRRTDSGKPPPHSSSPPGLQE